MLTPPISQADVDNKTTFENSNGDRGCVVISATTSGEGNWVYRTSIGHTYVVYSNGTHAYGYPQFRLIARIKEPDMDKQVVVEDRRQTKTMSTLFFENMPDDCLFEINRYPGTVFLKCGRYGKKIAGSHGVLRIDPGAQAACTPRPDLKLTMVLETRTA